MDNNPTPDDPDITLTAGGDLNTHYTIQRMATNKGIRTFGIWLAPDGNDCDEYQYPLQQVTTIKQRLSKAPIGCEHTWIGFQSIWCAMIQYPLGATCFTSQQCQMIQAKYMPTFSLTWALIGQQQSWLSSMVHYILADLTSLTWKQNRESWRQRWSYHTSNGMMK